METSIPQHDLNTHKELLNEYESLKQVSQTSSASQQDLVYHFFAQLINTLYRKDTRYFREISKIILKNTLEYLEDNAILTKELSVKIIKKTLDIEIYPDKMLGRIFLNNIRNTIVFYFWKEYAIMLDTKFLRDTNPPGTPEQNEAYEKIAHGQPTVTIPKDTEKLLDIIKWFHLIELIYTVHNNLNKEEEEEDLNPYNLNTCAGSMLNFYNQHGMKKMVWTNFLNIWYYDNG